MPENSAVRILDYITLLLSEIVIAFYEKVAAASCTLLPLSQYDSVLLSKPDTQIQS